MSELHQPIASQRTPRGPIKQKLLIVFGVFAASLAVASAWQILSQAFEAPEQSYSSGCLTGTKKLYGAVLRARQLVSSTEFNEKQALPAFRTALLPEWAHDREIRKTCRADSNPAEQKAFRAVELLRYAEERAVRFEAIDLSRLRRQAPKLLDELHAQIEKK